MINLQAGEAFLVGCPRLLIQYIHSDSPLLEFVFSIRNPGTLHRGDKGPTFHGKPI
jgi:hypothetical protein